MLKFSPANAKTKRLYQVKSLKKYLKDEKKVYSFDLLSGWNCPGANECKSRVKEKNGKRRIEDGPNCQFRCFSASQEVIFPEVYKSRLHNTMQVRGLYRKIIREKILRNLPKNAGIIRLHVSGDFFSREYFLAWYDVAKLNPHILFYSYTKSLHLLKYVKPTNIEKGEILPNFLLTASIGGKFDELIPQIGIRTSQVVFSEEETILPIDHNDSHCATKGGNFATLLHGIQPAGSYAAKMKKRLGFKGQYGRK